MDTDHRAVQLAAEQALEWLERLKDPEPADHAQFLRWLKQSPLNVRELLLATAMDTALRGMDRERAIDIDALLTRAACQTIPMPLGESARAATAGRRSLWQRAAEAGRKVRAAPMQTMAAAVAASVLVAIGALVIDAGAKERQIETEASEWRSKLLDDGTLIRIGPRTDLRVVMNARERFVYLAHGEVLFEVAKDRERPFVVHTRRAEARAVGTAFAVSQFADIFLVTVKDGAVVVQRTTDASLPKERRPETSAVHLRAGQQLAMSDAVPLTVKTVNVKAELAWLEGRLVSLQTTVAAAARAFNRRNRTQILIADPQLAQRHVVGTFQAADPESFVQVLLHSIPEGNVVRYDRPGFIQLQLLTPDADQGRKRGSSHRAD